MEDGCIVCNTLTTFTHKLCFMVLIVLNDFCSDCLYLFRVKHVSGQLYKLNN